MIDHQTYVILSIQTHLFDARQMKEHAIFIQAALPEKEKLLIMEADDYKKKFANLLAWSIRNSDQRVNPEILQSNELITRWTLESEDKTSYFTGIAIDSQLTKDTAKIQSGVNPTITQPMVEQIQFINTSAIKLLDSFIHFQQEMLRDIISCMKFTMMYSTMLEHLIEEAKWYRNTLIDLEHGVDIRERKPINVEEFWAHIMRDHAAFMRGMLDPSQSAEIANANLFVEQFNTLLDRIQKDENPVSVANEIRMRTQSLRVFKETATRDIDECKMKGIILPLLADHILREANHFIRLLLSIRI